MTKTTARYEHDCTDCVFLGTYGDADLYFCGVRTLMPPGTLLVRHSSDPSDYWSMWPPAITRNEGLVSSSTPAFVTAAQLAKAAGLI